MGDPVGAGKRGIVLRIERTSLYDGAGLRTVVFLKGCPLSCIWCSTPESQTSLPERGHISRNCHSCGACVDICPEGALMLNNDHLVYDQKRCRHCFTCVDICTSEANISYGRLMSVSEVMSEIAKDEVFYFHSGGGVTISGGECLLQPEFTAEILKQCLHLGINATVETSLCAPWESVQKILPYVTSIYVDMKHPEASEHKQLTGRGNQRILSNLEKIERLELALEVQLRIPLIPEVNDSEPAMQHIAAIVNRLTKISSIEILPYHRLGMATYDTLNKRYALTELPSPSKKYVEEKRKVLQKFLHDAVVLVSDTP